jgi:hypothetical protein
MWMLEMDSILQEIRRLCRDPSGSRSECPSRRLSSPSQPCVDGEPVIAPIASTRRNAEILPPFPFRLTAFPFSDSLLYDFGEAERPSGQLSHSIIIQS